MKTQSNEAPRTGNAAHTPTPWNKPSDDGCIIRNHRNQVIADTGSPALFIPWNEKRANAAFIVRACNSHAALVSALSRAESTLERHRLAVEEAGLLVAAQDMFFEAETARAALKLAKDGR